MKTGAVGPWYEARKKCCHTLLFLKMKGVRHHFARIDIALNYLQAGLNPGIFQVGFMVDKVARGPSFPEHFNIRLPTIIPSVKVKVKVKFTL